MLFVGDAWSGDHHNVEIVDDDGLRLERQRFPESATGLSGLQSLIADHLTEDADLADVIIGIEGDRGLWVQALVAAGYTVYSVNPLQAARHRERQCTSGSNSDPGDAHALADLARVHHRPVAGDSDTAEHVTVLAHTHASGTCSRQWRADLLRSMLWDFYPTALLPFGDLIDRDGWRIQPGPG